MFIVALVSAAGVVLAAVLPVLLQKKKKEPAKTEDKPCRLPK